MTITPIEDVGFDDAATFAMGEAFDRACKTLRNFWPGHIVREIIAKRIIDAAKYGARDSARLHEQALVPSGIEDSPIIFVGVGDPPDPVPAYAAVTHSA